MLLSTLAGSPSSVPPPPTHTHTQQQERKFPVSKHPTGPLCNRTFTHFHPASCLLLSLARILPLLFLTLTFCRSQPIVMLACVSRCWHQQGPASRSHLQRHQATAVDRISHVTASAWLLPSHPQTPTSASKQLLTPPPFPPPPILLTPPPSPPPPILLTPPRRSEPRHMPPRLFGCRHQQQGFASRSHLQRHKGAAADRTRI